MTEAKYQVTYNTHNARQCAWCSETLGSETFTVTFPDKDQATFHVACLYRYRAAMESRFAGRTERGSQGRSK